MFFEPIVGEHHVAFVTPKPGYSGPGNPVFLPPTTTGTLVIDGLPLYLSRDSYSLIAPKSFHSSDPNPLLFVEARVHLVPSTFEYPRPVGSWEIEFQKVVIDEVIRVETYRGSK